MFRLIISLAVATICVCKDNTFDDEVLEKLGAQAVGFLHYAVQTEEPYHDCMHTEVAYLLYTKGSDDYTHLYLDSKATLKASSFDLNLKTIIVVHGYTDSKDRKVIVALRKGLLSNVLANIIVVDWHRAAKQIYFTAVENSFHVGRELGAFLLFLEDVGVDLGDVHVIGHSLGAQIAGVAGERVDGRIGRITGLDPAGPLFEFVGTRNESISLDPSDAKFVDVIHTAAGAFGVIAPVGHADFYPNDGEVPQPGCDSIIFAISCSHVRSVWYYTESITSREFLSKRCSSWEDSRLANCSRLDLVSMGHHLSSNVRGNFYLQTSPSAPFARGGAFHKRTLN